jgi:hypothetical protein
MTMLALRCFVMLMAATFATKAADPPPVSLPPARAPFTTGQLARLNQALKSHHANYDPAARMVRERFHSPGYHTTLKGGFVHGTRANLVYAVALLDTGDEALRQRAEDVLRAVIALQDQNPESKTYGIWPWFFEEPLDKMSPPDWNWADFCGVQLLQVAIDHRSRLTPEVAALVDTSIRHAARSVQRRNVGPGYTNIAIMGAYVTLVAAEIYGWDDLRAYALARWKRFYDCTKEQGSFTEYNSPNYSVVALSELARMRLHAQDAGARRMVEELYRLAWEDAARHFHAPSRQWAGPHSRSYSTLLSKGTLAFIQRGSEGRLDFGADDPGIVEQRLPAPYPRELDPFFTTLTNPRDVVQTYLKAESPIVGTTHLEPAFALGTVNRGEFWNQRRALVAYWGTADKTSYLHLRFLRDGYDFSAAQFFSAQRGGEVVAAVNFATDGGNTHISLDRLKDGVFRAKDLRLRFEFGGEAGKSRLTAPKRLSEPVRVAFGELQVAVQVPYAAFGNVRPHWESSTKDSKAALDVVFHQGEDREFRMSDLEAAATGLAVSIAKERVALPAAVATVRDGRLGLEWGALRVNVPVKPGRVGVLQKAVRY